MFVNFTNHSSDRWQKSQLDAALCYGEIADIPFPNVSPCSDSDEVRELAAEYARRIEKMNPAAVLVQGEMTLAYEVIRLLKSAGITVLCATTERNSETTVTESGETVKKSVFSFVRFREF
jgi:hypothetical protein